jgi:ABC-type bacteriocin/lantibiotic exporter with double-glycine peptidase domain
MLLAIPDVRQRTEWDCGDAVVRAVLKYFGLRLPDHLLATPEHGTHPAQIQQELLRAGLKTLSGSFRVSQLKVLAADDAPVICAVRHDDGGGHWVVVRGVERGRVYFQCPHMGPRARLEGDWVTNWYDVGMYSEKFELFGIAAWKA